MTTKATILYTIVLLIICYMAYNIAGWYVLIPVSIGVILGGFFALLETHKLKQIESWKEN